MADERGVQLGITASSPSGCWSGAPRWDESQGEQLSLLQGLWHPMGMREGHTSSPLPQVLQGQAGRQGDTALQQLRAGWGLLIFHPRWVTGRGRKCRNSRWKGPESFQEAAVGRPEPGALRRRGHVPGIRPLPAAGHPTLPLRGP